MPLWKDNFQFDSSSQALDSDNKDTHVNTATPTYAYYPNDPFMPDLEDAGIFDDAYDDKDEDKMAEENIPTPTISDDQLSIHFISKCSIYLHKVILDTLTRKAKSGVYSFHLDEQWFTLNVNLLREALDITPVELDHILVSLPAGEQLWRAMLTLINQCLTGKTSRSDKPRHPVLQMLWGIVTRSNFTKMIIYYLEADLISTKDLSLRFTLLVMTFPMAILSSFPKKIFSNPLFDEEIIPMKIDQHHYNAKSDVIESSRTHDSSIIISSKIDSFFDEFAGELALLKSIPPRIDVTDYDLEEEIRLVERLLYDNSSPRLPKEFVSANSDTEIESFSPSPVPVKDSDSLMEEIDLSFTLDYPMPSGIEDDDYDSERDILILKYLLSNDTLSFSEKESFYFDIPSFSCPLAKPPDGNTRILNVKMMGDISKQKVHIPKLMITLAPNQENTPDHLSHLGLKAS
nr:hypothetical protein [Tanacetum cinerariifolium]